MWMKLYCDVKSWSVWSPKHAPEYLFKPGLKLYLEIDHANKLCFDEINSSSSLQNTNHIVYFTLLLTPPPPPPPTVLLHNSLSIDPRQLKFYNFSYTFIDVTLALKSEFKPTAWISRSLSELCIFNTILGFTFEKLTNVFSQHMIAFFKAGDGDFFAIFWMTCMNVFQKCIINRSYIAFKLRKQKGKGELTPPPDYPGILEDQPK